MSVLYYLWSTALEHIFRYYSNNTLYITLHSLLIAHQLIGAYFLTTKGDKRMHFRLYSKEFAQSLDCTTQSRNPYFGAQTEDCSPKFKDCVCDFAQTFDLSINRSNKLLYHSVNNWIARATGTSLRKI